MGPVTSKRFGTPQRLSTSANAKGKAVPGPRLGSGSYQHALSAKNGANYLVMRFSEITTESSRYSKSEKKKTMRQGYLKE